MASQGEKKTIRGTLRKKLDFHIQSFTSSKKGFTIEDYEDLKSQGVIRIEN